MFQINKYIYFVLLIIALPSSAATNTFDKLVKGKTCNTSSSQKIDCDYKISDSFWIQIIGVGEDDVGVAIMKSDYKGEYFAKVGRMHNCVIVNTGLKAKGILDYAFISPKTGKIYKSVEGCYSENKK
jgi:hypothetical protein